jgi:hypothetical protein
MNLPKKLYKGQTGIQPYLDSEGMKALADELEIHKSHAVGGGIQLSVNNWCKLIEFLRGE